MRRFGRLIWPGANTTNRFASAVYWLPIERVKLARRPPPCCGGAGIPRPWGSLANTAGPLYRGSVNTHRMVDQSPCSRTWCVFALALLVSVSSGCEGRAYREAAAKDTVQAYADYLRRYPKGGHQHRALESLDHARFRQARAADRPFGYRLYLQHHRRGGRHATEARRRLAELALKKAHDVAALRLVIERHRGTPQARKARVRLAAFEAREALKTQSASICSRFLRLYPDAKEARAVRSKLARIRFASLGDDPAALEAYIQRFAGTPWMQKASVRLRARLRADVVQRPTRRRLARLAGRFPNDPELGRLAERVRGRSRSEAMLRLDVDRLAAALPPAADQGAAAKQVRAEHKALATLCKRRPKRCTALRRQVGLALPWRPAEQLRQLELGLRAPDLVAVWRAMAKLAWTPRADAATLLADELRSPHLGVVWMAARALKRWLARAPRSVRQRWVAGVLARKPRIANADERQRFGALALLTQRKLPLGTRLLEGLLVSSKRRLLAAHLLLASGARPVPALPALVSAARHRLQRLKSAFPTKLDKASVSTGALVERELFALLRAVEQGLARRSTARAEQLRQRLRRKLLGWRAELQQIAPRFKTAAVPTFGGQAAIHDKGRGAALRGLVRQRSKAARSLARAVCARVARADLRRICKPLRVPPKKR
jgi:hypothetical protein